MFVKEKVRRDDLIITLRNENLLLVTVKQVKQQLVLIQF